MAGKLPSSLDATSLVLSTHDTSPVTLFIRQALYDATHNVFTAMIGIAVLSVIALLLMPARTEKAPEPAVAVEAA
ncbi:hypothetical protein ACFQ1S_20345 [Kibdelosporangium lantanae]|uniref:MFS transporter n=1 Tax=Kibdelosporangium lantanae TaxID=1497396 RepID=A0ABW3MAD0_9PSEU